MPTQAGHSGAGANRGLVHLVDDDELLRETIALFVAAGGWQAVQHSAGQAFIEALPQLQPGCVVLDINMPGMTGLQVLDALAARRVSWPVIVLTAENQLRTAVEAMKRGAVEFLQKPVDQETLIAALGEAADKLAEQTLSATQLEQGRALVGSLSPREHEVLRGLLAGMSNKTIAHELELSVRTVEIYRAKLMMKLHAKSLSAVVRMALDAGVEPLAATKRI